MITCLFISITSFNINNTKIAQASNTTEIIADILGSLYGDKGAEEVSKELIGCDDWEDISIATTVQSLFTSDKKDGACYAAGVMQAVGMAIGAYQGGYIGAAFGNFVSQGVIVFYVWLKSQKAEAKANNYHICLDTEEENHPLPYTDVQIARLLKLANMQVSLENIINQYKKICLYNNEGEYGFYGEGDEINGIYIAHANNYSYVMCASVIDACPCIFNLQHGKIKDPDYEKNDDGSIKMENGEMVYKNKDYYQQHYAKHCRIIRYKDLFEQTNDLSNIIDPACNDLRGYSKANVTLSGAIVQCIEGTARNIFEKPIFSSNRFVKPQENLTEQYTSDVTFLEKQVKYLKTIAGSKTLEMIKGKKQSSFNASEKKNFVERYQYFLYNKSISNAINYHCNKPISTFKYEYTTNKTSIYDKYISSPSDKPNLYCCVYETQTNPYTKTNYTEEEIKEKGICFSNNIITQDINFNIFKKGKTIEESDKNFYIMSEDQNYQELTDEDIFLLYKGAEQLLNSVKILQEKSSKVANIVGNDSILKQKIHKWTLFDLFRNNIKMIAIFFICFWFFLFGFKAITGDLKLEAKQIITQLIPFFLVFFLVFNDTLKNKLFELIIKTTQGAVIAVNQLFYNIRSDNSNTVRGKCEFGSQYAFTPTKKYLNKDNPEIIEVNKECSQSTLYPLKESCYERDKNNVCIKKQCVYYQLDCGDTGGDFVCSQYLVRNNKIYKNACQRGYCSKSTGNFIIRPPFERPYKIYKTYDRRNGGGWTTAGLAPKCHTVGVNENTENGFDAQIVYSYSLDQNVYVCKNQSQVMDSGYRVSALINAGIIEDNDQELEIFASLSPKYQAELKKTNNVVMSNDIYEDIKRVVVPTSVADINIYGDIKEINFTDDGRATEGKQRKQYAQYLSSKIVALNKTADYPIIKDEYSGIIRDYHYLSFWDYLDCTVIQYLTFETSGNGLSNNSADLVNAIKDNDSNGITNSLLSGLWSAAKFIIMAFPFGLLAFIFSIMIAVAIFLLVARATQQYCLCVVNIVIIIYLSPLIFVLFMFDATKKAKDVWLKELKTNIAGCCVPFLALSMSLFVVDWVMFGDSSKYVEETMFNSEGVDDNCYKGHEKDAPIACLSTRLLKNFNLWTSLWGLITGSSHQFNYENGKMMGFLCIRLFIGLAVFVMTAFVANIVEGKIYDMVGAKPNKDLNIGFNQNILDSYKTAGKVGLSTFKPFGTTPYNFFKYIFGGGLKKDVQSIFSKKNNNKNDPEKIAQRPNLYNNIQQNANQNVQQDIQNRRNENIIDDILHQNDAIQRQKDNEIADLKSRLSSYENGNNNSLQNNDYNRINNTYNESGNEIQEEIQEDIMNNDDKNIAEDKKGQVDNIMNDKIDDNEKITKNKNEKVDNNIITREVEITTETNDYEIKNNNETTIEENTDYNIDQEEFNPGEHFNKINNDVNNVKKDDINSIIDTEEDANFNDADNEFRAGETGINKIKTSTFESISRNKDDKNIDFNNDDNNDNDDIDLSVGIDEFTGEEDRINIVNESQPIKTKLK